MLAELAAANAAFDVIKQTIANGKEIYDAVDSLSKYFGLKQEIQRKAHEHGYKSDLEAFMAEEQLKAQEDELKQMMIYQGRAGMWDDWLQFQSTIKRSREKAERDKRVAAEKRKQALINTVVVVGAGVFVIGAILGFLAIIL
jgi:hypothetical protein